MPGPVSLMLAEGSIPRLPVSMEASSDRISPNRLAVTIVSKTLGLRNSCIAALSMYLHELRVYSTIRSSGKIVHSTVIIICQQRYQ